MTRNKKIVIGGLVLAALTAGGIAVSAERGGWGHGGGHGMRGGMMGGMMGAICKGDASEKADLMLVRLEYKLKPVDAQKQAFEELKTAAKSAAIKAKAGCPPPRVRPADGTRPAPKSPTERLAMMETALTAQLDAVRTVRPAAEKFYATLSDEQKNAVTQRRGRGMGGWGREDDGERGGRGHHGRGMHRGDMNADDGDTAAPSPAPEKR